MADHVGCTFRLNGVVISLNTACNRMRTHFLLSPAVGIILSHHGPCNAFARLITVVHRLPLRRQPSALHNMYDDWRSDAVVPTLPLDENNVRECLEIFVESDYGQQMFGCHEKAASVGITGEVQFADLEGPEVVLKLEGAFWHRRETVLGRAAMWLNACMPEIVQVRVADPQELEDFAEVIDDLSGEVLEVVDKRAPDFNGDRATMEYQGIDPDVRGPFPPGVGESFTINPV